MRARAHFYAGAYGRTLRPMSLPILIVDDSDYRIRESKSDRVLVELETLNRNRIQAAQKMDIFKQRQTQVQAGEHWRQYAIPRSKVSK